MSVGYGLIDEGDDHYMVQDNSTGQQVAIPKKDIDKDTVGLIKSLPRVGQEVDPEFRSTPVPTFEGGGLEGFTPMVAQPAELTGTELDPELKMGLRGRPGAIAQAEPAPGGAAGSWRPEPGTPEIVQAAGGVQQAIPMPAPAADPMAGYLKDYAKAFGQQRSAINMAAEAQAQAAKDAAVAQENYMAQLSQSQKTYADKRAALDAETDRLQADVANQKIDPNQWWNKQTSGERTGKKILAFIGAVLGGLTQMKTGVNPTIAALDNLINRDIDSQKEDMKKKQNLLYQNWQKYGNLQAAETATRLDMTNMLQAQLGRIASQSQSQTAKANAQAQLADLSLKQAELKHKLASEYSMTSLLGQMQNTGLTEQAVPLLPKELQERVVKMPNGQVMLARDKADVQPLAKVQTATKNLMDTIAEMEKYMEDPNARELTSWSDKADTAKGLQTRAQAQIREIGDPIRIGEGTMKFLNGLIPDPSAWDQGGAKERLRVLKDMVNSTIQNEMQSRVLGYNPPSKAAAGAPGGFGKPTYAKD